MNNIELKVALKNATRVVEILKERKAKFAGTLKQSDTYIDIDKGRLKFREINNRRFQIIFYQRPDVAGSKLSKYRIIRLDKKTFQNSKNVFKKLFGIKIVVKKTRKLWLYQNTRVHLDKVAGLGNYLELETVIDKISMQAAGKEHKMMIEMLNLEKHKKIGQSYSDLLANKHLR